MHMLILFVALNTLASCKKSGFAVSGQTYVVRTETELLSALRTVSPADTIDIQAVQLNTKILIERSGLPGTPIILKGNGVIIRGTSLNTDYGLWLRSNNWKIENIIFENFKKGIVLDAANSNDLTSLTVRQIGEEGIHFRSNSSYNKLQSSMVSDVGLTTAAFGEGIYVGSANSNWCDYSGCGPDKSDYNLIQNNTVQRTTAESIDIKEGVTGNQILQNNLFGNLISGQNSADSLMDIKGNSNIIRGNILNSNNNSIVVEAIQTHVRFSGWGNLNLIESNTMSGNYSGYGINNDPASTGNVIKCSNVASSAALGLSNVICVPN